MCTRQFTQKYTSRPSPPYPANLCCGTVKEGNDGRMYHSVANSAGICTWRPYAGGGYPKPVARKRAPAKKVGAAKKKPATKKVGAAKKVGATKKKAVTKKKPATKKKAATKKPATKKVGAAKKKAATKKAGQPKRFIPGRSYVACGFIGGRGKYCITLVFLGHEKKEWFFRTKGAFKAAMLKDPYGFSDFTVSIHRGKFVVGTGADVVAFHARMPW